jgi:hypothetical protein
MTEGDVIGAAVDHQVQDAFTRALTNLKATVNFERTVSRGEYSNQDKKTAGLHVQVDYAPDCSVEEWLELVRDAFRKAASSVYEQLGIDCEEDESGVLREVLDAFPGATVEPTYNEQAATPPPASTPVRLPAKPPYTKAQIDALEGDEWKAARNENAQWAKTQYDNGHAADFWDNRLKKSTGEYSDTAYDFSHKRFKGVGFWLPRDRSNS